MRIDLNNPLINHKAINFESVDIAENKLQNKILKAILNRQKRKDKGVYFVCSTLGVFKIKKSICKAS